MNRSWLDHGLRWLILSAPYCLHHQLFMMMDEGEERVKAAYRGNYHRLAEVKSRYDPDNLFHVNQNIKPVPSRSPTTWFAL